MSIPWFSLKVKVFGAIITLVFFGAFGSAAVNAQTMSGSIGLAVLEPPDSLPQFKLSNARIVDLKKDKLALQRLKERVQPLRLEASLELPCFE